MAAVPFRFPLSDTGAWCFDVVDARGVRLRFSFSGTEQSMHTALQLGDTPMIIVAHEGAQSIERREPGAAAHRVTRHWRFAAASAKWRACFS